MYRQLKSRGSNISDNSDHLSEIRGIESSLVRLGVTRTDLEGDPGSF